MNLCKQGHDTDVVGIKKNRGCRVCYNAYQRKNYATVRGGNAKRATCRRTYLRNTERKIRAVEAWNNANPDKVRGYKKKYAARYRGVGFWVEQARNSV